MSEDTTNAGSARFELLPDDDSPRDLVWEWNPEASDDIDQLFARVREGTATDTDHQLFDACMLDRFISRTGAGEPVEPWILARLSEIFIRVLMGGAWHDEIYLPGRSQTPVRSPKEQRNLEIYCDVSNLINLSGHKVTDALTAVADARAVSYETARAAYYQWRDRLSKSSANSEKD